MSVTLATLLSRAKSAANLATNTAAGILPTGSGGADDESTDAFLTRVFNDGQNLLARCGAAPLDMATLVNWPIDQRSARLTAFTPVTTGRVLFAVTGAKWGTAGLEMVRRDVLDLHDPTYRSGTLSSGTPTMYWTDGDEAGLYVPPSSLATVTAFGYFLPAPITSMVAFSLLGDDYADTLVNYALTRLGEKNLDNPDLAARIPIAQSHVDEVCLALWLGLARRTREEYFADAPIAAKARKMAQP
jgi:hypothetical protein